LGRNTLHAIARIITNPTLSLKTLAPFTVISHILKDFDKYIKSDLYEAPGELEQLAKRACADRGGIVTVAAARCSPVLCH
jgi:hypothetical protein